MVNTKASRGIVSFDPFNVYLPVQGTLGNIAGVLRSVLADPANRTRAVPGQLAADFVAAVHPAARCRLLDSDDCDDYAVAERGSDHRVQVSWRGGGYFILVYPVRNGQEKLTPEFRGSLDDLAGWLDSAHELGHIAQKVVQFKYDGGSKPGSVRTVRVEDVERDANGALHICGIDLEKDDLKHAYRKYSYDKVDGKISVLN
jgi:hypothetical protein